MADQVIVKTKSESNATPSNPEQGNQGAGVDRSQLMILCAVGLGICFFLPWANFFGAKVSGFDLQKMGDLQRLLWIIPIFSGITVVAGFTKRSQRIAGQLTGALPFFAAIYWYSKLGSDLMQILTYGAYLSFIFGAALFILPRR